MNECCQDAREGVGGSGFFECDPEPYADLVRGCYRRILSYKKIGLAAPAGWLVYSCHVSPITQNGRRGAECTASPVKKGACEGIGPDP